MRGSNNYLRVIASHPHILEGFHEFVDLLRHLGVLVLELFRNLVQSLEVAFHQL